MRPFYDAYAYCANREINGKPWHRDSAPGTGREGWTERKREGCEGEVGKGGVSVEGRPLTAFENAVLVTVDYMFFLATARCRPVSAAKPKRQQDARFVDTEPRHTEPTNHNNRRYQFVDEGDTDDDDDDIDWQDDAVLPPYLLNSAARRKPSPTNCRLQLVALVLTSVLLHTVRWRGATARHRTSINESIY